MDKCPFTGLPCPHKRQIHATEIANYQATQTIDMCVFCGVPYIAKEGGPDFNTGAFQIFKLINSIIKDPNVGEAKVGLQPTIVNSGCPTCGCTMEEIANTGKLGCGNCYEFYKKELLPLIERIQSGAIKHIGKLPKHSDINLIKKLEDELTKAVAEENYARAAVLRDEIKKLKTSK